jgi:hypothetical protein
MAGSHAYVRSMPAQYPPMRMDSSMSTMMKKM